MGSPLVYLIAGIAFLAALGGLYYKVHHDGYEQGIAEIQGKWDEANKKATAEEAARQAAAKLVADTSAAELAAAQQRASDADAKWRTERSKHANQTLAGCKSLPQSPTANATVTADTTATNSDVRFSLGFVRLYDTAWTDQAGKPVFGNQPAASGGTADTPDALTAIGPGEVLDNHALNAEACSVDRRKLDSLIGQIEKLRAGWH